MGKETKTKKNTNRKAVILYSLAIALVLIVLALIIYSIVRAYTEKPQNPIATIEVENFGTIKVELYPDLAPNTVTNFIRLAQRGYYNNLTFHRTIPDFMIQGGDSNGDGTGAPKLSNIKDNVSSKDDASYAIKGEFIANGYNKNNLKHQRGVISMARGDYSSIGMAEQGYNSAGSQFFIMTADNSSLDGAYAGFGKVIEGMDVVDKISNVEVETRESQEQDKTADRPLNPPVITSITVETYGQDYGIPDTVKPFDYSSYMMNQYGLGGSY